MFFFRKKKSGPAFVPVVLPDPAGPEDRRRKILVVDDDPVVTKTISLALNARGYEVLCASDCAGAIKAVREQDPDVMLVDVGLPPDIAMGGAHLSDGFQVTGWLKRANLKNIPSIIISGSNKPAFKCKASAVGADAFLSKPIDNEALVESIESALAHSVPIHAGSTSLKMAAAESFEE